MKKTILSLIAFGPMFALAQADVFSVANITSRLLATIIPILFSVALVYFLWGVIKYVIAADADDQAKSKRVIFRGIIGLFVMTSVWGLVGFINRSVGIPQDNPNTPIPVPSPLPPNFN